MPGFRVHSTSAACFISGSNKPITYSCSLTGTHVAASAIGRSVGVAKGAELVAVRVLDCNGSGTISDTVAGDVCQCAYSLAPKKLHAINA